MPISDEQALAAFRERTPARVNVAALSRDWGWTHDKVRNRLRRWRRTGELPPAAKGGKAGNRPAIEAAAAAAAALVVPTLAAVPPQDAIVVAPPGEVAAAAQNKAAVARQAEAAVTPQAEAAVAPQAAPVPVIDPPAQRAPRPARSLGRLTGMSILALVGIALAAIGMVETTAYAVSVGGSVFAALAICADLLVLAMPAAVAALWRRRSPAAILAAALWLVGGAVTLANLSGFIGGSDDHFRSGRETQSIGRTLALEQLARLRHERAAIVETRPVTLLRVAVRSASRASRPGLREALAMAERRDAVEAQLAAIAANLAALPPLVAIDPSASVLSELTGATVTDAELRRLRLALLLLLPLCGGFVLSLGLSLLPLRAERRAARAS
ncbi:MAG TPA: hypothetical protein VFU97_21115 [Xanthobacteraceae bacterium]|nr:hypothetical protein [Xanthobacteraceae bacterium]